MRVVRDLTRLHRRRPLCLAMGVFDGVHVGHQAIIRRALHMSTPGVGLPAVLTFEPHPDAVLRPEGAAPLLTTTEEKLALLRTLGVGFAIVARFDAALARMPAEVFVREVLAQRLRARCLVVGDDWRFGARGEGTIAALRRMAGDLGLSVSAIPAVTVGGERVSSTRIRDLIATGLLDPARECLGRPYGVSGRIVSGEGRGRQLGYPTANLDLPEDKLVPPDGVYACWAGIRRLRPAVANIGLRPTFGEGGGRRIEVHLLEAPRGTDLLGRALRVLFIERLREERRFAGGNELVRQIEADSAHARHVLALHGCHDVV